MLGGLLGIVDGAIAFIILTLNRFISTPAVTWTKGGADNQWIAVLGTPVPTAKGVLVIDDLATIIHYGLDTVAAIMAWLTPSF